MSPGETKRTEGGKNLLAMIGGRRKKFENVSPWETYIRVGRGKKEEKGREIIRGGSREKGKKLFSVGGKRRSVEKRREKKAPTSYQRRGDASPSEPKKKAEETRPAKRKRGETFVRF